MGGEQSESLTSSLNTRLLQGERRNLKRHRYLFGCAKGKQKAKHWVGYQENLRAWKQLY